MLLQKLILSTPLRVMNLLGKRCVLFSFQNVTFYYILGRKKKGKRLPYMYTLVFKEECHANSFLLVLLC